MSELKDEAESALRLLAQAQPPSGMQDRVLARLRKADEATVVAGQRTWMYWVVPVAGSCALAMAMMLPVWRPRSAPALRIAGENTAASESQVMPASTGALAPAITKRRAAYRRSYTTRRSSQTVEEASFPAPPAPLTHDEELLLELSRLPERAAAAVADDAVVHEDASTVFVERLPSLPRETLGHPLPALATEAPGHPLPNFFEAMKTGDQP